MTAVQISFSRGTDDRKMSSFTVGTSAPGTGDIELRYNLLDGQSVAITKKDIVKACNAFIRAIQSDKVLATAVSGTNYTGPQL